jgi:hypothetical protein
MEEAEEVENDDRDPEQLHDMTTSARAATASGGTVDEDFLPF